MKNLFIASFLVCGLGVFANNEKNPSLEKSSEEVVATVCCQRNSSNEYGDTATITYCVNSTGDFAMDKGRACAGAASIANQIVTIMKNMH